MDRSEVSLQTAPAPAKSGFRRFIPLLILAAGLAAFFASGLQHQLTLASLKAHRDELQTWVHAHPLMAPVLYGSIYALAVACSIPASWMFTVTAGFLFGLYEGTLVAMLSATTGATIIFLSTRTALADFFERRAGAAIRKLEAGFRKNAFNYLFALRLMPVVPFALINLAAGLLGVSLRTFVTATLIGIIPACAIYVGIGSGLGALFDSGHDPDLKIIFQPQILLPLVALALFSLVPVIWQRLRRRPPD
jgi:uncharacterized membrane protein YdjX (TVP38/TMEM64 family)